MDTKIKSYDKLTDGDMISLDYEYFDFRRMAIG